MATKEPKFMYDNSMATKESKFMYDSSMQEKDLWLLIRMIIQNNYDDILTSENAKDWSSAEQSIQLEN